MNASPVVMEPQAHPTAAEKKRKRESKHRSGVETSSALAGILKELKRAAEQAIEDSDERARLEQDNRALRSKVANLDLEVLRLGKEIRRLNHLVAKMKPVTKTAFELKDNMDRVYGLAATAAKSLNEAVENEGICTFCNMEETLILLDGGEFHRLECPECKRVNQCCSACMPAWKRDAKHPGMCVNRGYCGHKFSL